MKVSVRIALIFAVLEAVFLLWQIPTSALAAGQEESCKNSASNSWKAQEAWIWRELCASGVADLRQYDDSSELDPSKEKGWQGKREVSPDFLTDILTDKRYSAELIRPYLTIRGMWVRKALDLTDLVVYPSFAFNSSRFEKAVTLGRTVTRGDVDFAASTFLEKLDLAEAEISGDVFLRRSHMNGLDLSYAKVGGNVELPAAISKGVIDLSDSEIANTVFMNEKVDFSDVDLADMQTEGSVYLGGTIARSLEAVRMRVGHDFSFDDGTIVQGRATISRSSIEGSLDLSGTNFSQVVSIFGSRVGRMTIHGSTFLDDIDLRSSTIDHELDLTARRLRGHVWCSAVGVGGIFKLAQDDDEPEWGTDSMLDLSATSVGGVSDSDTAWPRQLALQGFTYGSGAGERVIRDGKVSAPLLERSSEWYVDWLGRSTYSRQSYKELETALRAVGNRSAADDVAVAGEDRSRDTSLNPVSWLYGAIVGYGYRPLRAIIPAAILIMIGAYALSHMQYDEEEIPSPIMLSIQRLIPLVTLGENYSKFDLTSGRVPKRIRRYFYFHSFCGYVLAGFLLAGLTRITTVN
jgi:uncharacterized protein YjbI with pentapeptide repeats